MRWRCYIGFCEIILYPNIFFLLRSGSSRDVAGFQTLLVISIHPWSSLESWAGSVRMFVGFEKRLMGDTRRLFMNHNIRLPVDSCDDTCSEQRGQRSASVNNSHKCLRGRYELKSVNKKEKSQMRTQFYLCYFAWILMRINGKQETWAHPRIWRNIWRNLTNIIRVIEDLNMNSKKDFLTSQLSLINISDIYLEKESQKCPTCVRY